jgi:3-hydroxyacyl-CoA dehydrogenase
MMNKRISKVAVLGSGIMGSRIACHFANIGVEVLLLDIVSKEGGRNSLVDSALQTAVKTNPSPIYSKKVLSKISTGNFEDDMFKIANVDWIIEVVVENLDIKKKVFEQVEQFRKPGTLVTSNTSGIPIHKMAEDRSEDFQANFCGTHFFNPPRYLRLLEIIPTQHTNPALVDFLMNYGDKFLGKTTVLCKDTPAFIANRVGVYSIMALLHLVEKMELTVEEVDKFTGPALGRPKSATFRTTDVVGLDTMIKVSKGLYENCPDDKAHDLFKLPAYVEQMAANNWLGDKSKQGFYKKTKTLDGQTEILALDLKTLEYRPQQKVKSASLDLTKSIENVRDRMKVFVNGKDKAAELFRASFFGLFEYVSDRIPEISDELYRIDDAMRAGFGWDLGPFEVWDAIGLKEALTGMKAYGHEAASWVQEMIDGGFTSFYKIEDGVKKYYDILSKTYKAVPGTEAFVVLDNLRTKNLLWKNSGASIIDLGDGILNVEFHSKMNTIGGDTLQAINKAIDMAEKDYRGVVIGNDGTNFSAGANVGMIFMLAVEQEWDELNLAVRMFQNTSMRIRYSSIPVVVAPHNLTLGGGCEFSLHADHVQLNAETYMGLVEFGVGVIPGGGGSKEFALRASDEYKDDQIVQNALKDRFLTIGMAKVSTSAVEAFELGYLQKDKYSISMNRSRLIADAKAKAIEMADAGYTRPIPRKDIKVLGKQGLGIVYAGANTMYSGHYISAHDKKISEKLGYVMCGGDLSSPTEVSEQYLLDLEREAFLSLCGERKTLERIQSIVTKGKPLRN